MSGIITTKAQNPPRFLLSVDDYIDRIVRGRYESRLLESGHGMDITYELIPANVTFYMDSAAEWPGFEFVYLIRGELHLLEGESQHQASLLPGTCIVRHAIPKRTYYKAHTDVELLHVCSPAAFESMAEENEDFFDVANQLEADEYVNGHCKRLESLAVRIGEELGLAGHRLGNLSYAAFFHDVGKLKVPDSILNKPDRLTEKEFEIIKGHSAWGRDMISVKGFLREAGKIVEQVHERLDGTGYPKGLKGDEILLEARIISVVDSYDAMTSSRPYRSAMPHEHAMAELRRCAGTQFDPQVVEAFCDIVEQESDTCRLTGAHWDDEELTRRKQRQAFLKIGAEILNQHDIDSILADVTEGIRNVTVFDSVLLLLLDEPIQAGDCKPLPKARLAFAGPEPQSAPSADRFSQLGACLQEEFRTGSTYRIPASELPDGLREEIRTSLSAPVEDRPSDIQTLNVIPLWMENETIMGLILTLWDRPRGRPSTDVLEPIELFANLAALGVLEAERRERLCETVAQLESLVVTDPLTGLFNRRYLLDIMRREQSRAERHQQGVGLIMMDLVNFRRVNNEHGHLEGDRVLQDLSALLLQTKREEDSLIRYGGDEFALLMPGTDLESVGKAARRVESVVSAHSFNLPFNLEIRTGEAHWKPGDPQDLESTLQIADDWMYGRMGT